MTNHHDSFERAPADKAPAFAGQEPQQARPAAPSVNRKLIYRANVELVVEDFSGTAEKLTALVKEFDGYVADANQSGSPGENRRARWKIRVPVARFDEILKEVKKLGEPVSATVSSQDVSEEYYDAEARIRNKTKEEARLLTLLEERPGKLEDVIAIERELSRVREELERIQGRMRVLTDLTSMTTIDLSVTEIQNYAPAEVPTLATRAGRAFYDSLSGLRVTAESALIALVAITPWTPLVAAVAGLAFVIYRRFGRPRRVRGTASTAV